MLQLRKSWVTYKVHLHSLKVTQAHEQGEDTGLTLLGLTCMELVGGASVMHVLLGGVLILARKSNVGDVTWHVLQVHAAI